VHLGFEDCQILGWETPSLANSQVYAQLLSSSKHTQLLQATFAYGSYDLHQEWIQCIWMQQAC
jgi:hypothetical protein